MRRAQPDRHPVTARGYMPGLRNEKSTEGAELGPFSTMEPRAASPGCVSRGSSASDTTHHRRPGPEGRADTWNRPSGHGHRPAGDRGAQRHPRHVTAPPAGFSRVQMSARVFTPGRYRARTSACHRADYEAEGRCHLPLHGLEPSATGGWGRAGLPPQTPPFVFVPSCLRAFATPRLVYDQPMLQYATRNSVDGRAGWCALAGSSSRPSRLPRGPELSRAPLKG
jgi:hypothetical protein